MFGGYDHNFILAGAGWRRAAVVTRTPSGRMMELWTDQPGVQLYTANKFDKQIKVKNGGKYEKHQDFCLETQTIPNAAGMPWLNSPVFKAGQEYSTKTEYRFSTFNP